MAEQSSRKRVAPRRAVAVAPVARSTGRTAHGANATVAATRIAAVLAFAVLAATGASVHALVFWAATLFLLVRFSDLERLYEDSEADGGE